MTAPESWWAPATLPFSSTATGTSPRRSVMASSFSSSCSSRMAQASPAWPPPTIATPTSMRSSSGSVTGPMNSLAEFTGGGNIEGATTPTTDLVRGAGRPLPLAPAIRSAAPLGLHGLGDLGQDRAGDARGEVELRRHGLARLADLRRVGVPAGVDHRAGRGHAAAHRPGQRLEQLEALGLAQPAAAGHEHVGVLDVDVGPALLAALDHRRARRPGGELDVDVLHGGRAGARALADLERVQAADDHPEVALVARLGDRGVLEDRALGDQLATVDLDRGDLHGDAGLHAGGQAGPDLEAEQPAAEQRVALTVVGDDLRHRVDDRLGQALGSPDPEGLGGSVGTQLGDQLVGEVVAAEDERVGLAAGLAGHAGGLGDRAQGVLVEGALVVQDVDQDVGHLDQLPLVQPGDDLRDRLVGVLVLDDLPGLLGRRGVEVAAVHARSVRAHDPDVELDIARADLGQRLLLGAHDRLQRRVARLVDGVADRDHGRELDLDGVVAVLGLALAAQRLALEVDLDDLGQRGHLQVVGHDGADRVALAVVGLLAEEDQVRALGLQRLGQRVAGGGHVGAGEHVVGELDGAVGAQRDGLVQGAHRGLGAHRHGDHLVDLRVPALLDLHRRLDGVGVERVEVLLPAAVQAPRRRIDPLLDGGVGHLFDQDTDLHLVHAPR